MSSEEKDFDSFRGTHSFIDGDWEYKYKKDGDVDELSGYEEIHYKGEKAFWHRIIGGNVKHRK